MRKNHQIQVLKRIVKGMLIACILILVVSNISLFYSEIGPEAPVTATVVASGSTIQDPYMYFDGSEYHLFYISEEEGTKDIFEMAGRFSNGHIEWRDARRIPVSNDLTHEKHVSGFYDGAKLLLFWSEREKEKRESDIVYAIRENGMWSEVKKLTDDAVRNQYPSAFRDKSGRIWVFWSKDILWKRHNYDTPLPHSYYSTFDGANWSKPRRLTDSEKNVPEYSPSAFQDSSGRTWVFWYSHNKSDWKGKILYKYTEDGINWSNPQELASQKEFGGIGYVSAFQDSSGRICVLYFLEHVKDEGYRTFYVQGELNETQKETRVDWCEKKALSRRSFFSTVFAFQDSSGKHWLFYDTSGYTYSDDGRNWSKMCYIPHRYKFARQPSAFRDSSGKYWLFFQSGTKIERWYGGKVFTDSGAEICCKWSGDGASWSERQRIISGGSNKNPVAFQDSSGKYWLFWASKRNSDDYDIYYALSEDGINWGEDKKLVDNQEDIKGLSAFCDSSGAIWLFWSSNLDGDYDIYCCKHTLNEGWSQPIRLTFAKSNDRTPSAVHDTSGNYWLFWTKEEHLADDKVVNTTIYYMRSEDGYNWIEPIKFPFEGTQYSPSAFCDYSGKITLFFAGIELPRHRSTFMAISDDGDWSVRETNLRGYFGETLSAFQDSSNRSVLFWDGLGVNLEIYTTTVESIK